MYSRFGGRELGSEEISRAARRAAMPLLEVSAEEEMGWAKVALRMEYRGASEAGTGGGESSRVRRW